MNSIKKSIKTSWWLFAASNGSKKTVLMSRISLITIPIVLGVGIAIALGIITGLPYVGAIAGVIATFIAASLMVKTSPSVAEQVDEYLHKDPEEHIVGTTDYIKVYEIETKSKYKPAFYYGAGEWMCSGHAPIKEFIEAIQEADNILSNIPYQTLEDAVQYHYAVEQCSKKLGRDVLKIVPKSTPGCTPITRLRVASNTFTY